MQLFLFFNNPANTEIYTLSLHDALPIFDVGHDVQPSRLGLGRADRHVGPGPAFPVQPVLGPPGAQRSEEHTSELLSQSNLVCRLLLEKKKKTLHNSQTVLLYLIPH